MNEKNSLGLNLCFKDHNNPIKLFEEWFNKAKKTEINDPNAFAVAVSYTHLTLPTIYSV